MNSEQVGVLRLSTLHANTIVNTTATRAALYSWFVDWGEIFGHADEDDDSLTYQVEHFFEGNFEQKLAIPNAPSSTLNVPYGFSVPQATMIYVSTNLPIFALNAPPDPTLPLVFNGNLTTAFTTIYQAYPQFVSTPALGNVYGYWYATSRRSRFICKSPLNNRIVSIQVNPASIKNGNATNAYNTTGDFYTSGIHTFTFYRVQNKLKIMREIDPEIIGTLTLSTLNSFSQTFNATTGSQMYVWNNVDWNYILGHIPTPQDSVWEVTVEFSPNATPSQTVTQAQGAAGINQAQFFSPAIFISSSLRGKNNTPNLFNTIGTLSYFLTCAPIIGSTYYQWVYATVSRTSKFVCYNPELNPQVTIITTPTFNATYTQSTGVNVTVIQSYPADNYTSGDYKFTFRRIKNKPVT